MTTRNPTHADFSARLGNAFEVQVAEHCVSMTLEGVQELPDSGREGGSFRLEFLGPSDQFLGQGMFPFLSGGERFDLFIVPVGQDGDRIRYEAIFF
ncbi:MAG TPA: hypothetical protein VEW71_01560 [Allosphingosinicella sp.]|nr:hypothetical protein [Allosphingosinicella sp.]